jgi:hypothetical protein
MPTSGAGRAGPCVRVTRRGRTRWDGRVHAVPTIGEAGGTVRTFPRSAAWVHDRPDRDGSRERDRRILRGWLREEPTNAHALGLSGEEELDRGNVRRAAKQFGRYLNHPGVIAALGESRLIAAQAALARLDRGDAPEVRTILFGAPA